MLAVDIEICFDGAFGLLEELLAGIIDIFGLFTKIDGIRCIVDSQNLIYKINYILVYINNYILFNFLINHSTYIYQNATVKLKLI